MIRNENAAYAMARILMAVIFLVAGVRKLLTFTATAGYFGHLGIPLPELVVALTIALEIGGGVALVFGWAVRPVALALGIFTLAAAFLGHRFWSAEPAQFASQLNHFLKNLAMVGGFVVVALEAANRQRRAVS